MKYEQSYTEFDYGIINLIKKTIPSSFAGYLKESGVDLTFPQDKELELKVKYDVREDGGSFALKFSWDNEVEEEEEEEVEEGDED